MIERYTCYRCEGSVTLQNRVRAGFREDAISRNGMELTRNTVPQHAKTHFKPAIDRYTHNPAMHTLHIPKCDTKPPQWSYQI